MPTYSSPSQAIANDACPVCLGDGRTFDLIAGAEGDCHGCGGSGRLADMLAKQCDNPRCPDHHPEAGHLHIVQHETMYEVCCDKCDEEFGEQGRDDATKGKTMWMPFTTEAARDSWVKHHNASVQGHSGFVHTRET